MADLTDIQAAGATRVIGSDSSGLETNPLAVDSNGNLKVGLTSDGTNVVTVTAPSTAPLATDRAIVVAISPNTAVSTNNNQGSPNTLANAWPVKITEGTNILGTGTDPIRVDPTGTTAQPITDNGGSITVDGSISVSNFPSVQPVSDNGSSLTVDGAVNADIRVAGSAVANGNPVPVSDAGGSLTVDGSVSASQSGTWNINDIAGTVSLPTGAATEATLSTLLTTSAFQARINTLGQKTMANSTPVVLSSDQSAIPASQSGTWNITNISGTISLPTGAATETTLSAINTKLPASLVGGRLDSNIGSWLGSTVPTVGQKTMANSIPVVLSSDQSTLPISMASGGYGGQVEGRAANGSAAVGNPVAIGGLEGSTTRSVAVDSVGRIIVAPAGATASAAGFRMGYVTTGATTQVPVRATVYTEQTSNAQRSVVSSSAADTAAGTGARTIRITYLTATFTGPFTEDITLNGTTAVNSVATNICYIERIEVLTAGSGGTNAGTISLRATTGGGGATIWSIAVGDNRTFGLHHYTPTGLTTYITSLSTAHNGTTVGSGALFILRALDQGTANAVERQVSDFHRQFGQSGTISRNYGTPIEIPGPARIQMYVTPEGSGSVIYRASFDYYDQ